MFGQVVIETSRESVTEYAHLWIEAAVFLARQTRNFERAIPAILVKTLFTIHFRGAAKSKDEILFYAPEVIFSLSVGKTENSAGVGSPKDVWDAIPIAIDGHHSG